MSMGGGRLHKVDYKWIAAIKHNPGRYDGRAQQQYRASSLCPPSFVA